MKPWRSFFTGLLAVVLAWPSSTSKAQNSQKPQASPDRSAQPPGNRPPGKPGNANGGRPSPPPKPKPGQGSSGKPQPQPGKPGPGGTKPPSGGGGRLQPGNPGRPPVQPSKPFPGGGNGNRPQPNPRPIGPPHRPPQWGRPPQHRPAYHFRPTDRAYLRRFYLSHLRAINLARRPVFAAGGFFPYADITYLRPLPPNLYGYLPPPPPGYMMGYFDGYVVVYDPVSYFVADVIDLVP